ncbi:MAG: hypothetical protein ACTSYZ_03990 [Candidatus Helarchaeota archaeon]
MIEFKKIKKYAEFHNPMYNFELKKQKVEFREDPLTGQNCIIPESLLDKVKIIMNKPSKNIIQNIIENTQAGCPFCPDKIMTQTPNFDEKIIPNGKIQIDGAIGFPNIFSFFEHSAVIVFTEKHFLNLDEFSPDIIYSALKVAREYTHYILKEYENVECNCILGCNYLYSAGSTIVHPHFQLYLSENNFYYNKILLINSKKYFEKNKKNFWDDLINSEKNLKERYIGAIGTTEWLVSFAPLGVYEIQCIVKNKTCIHEFTDNNLKDIAQGLSNVLKFYHKNKVTSFNFALYSAPYKSKDNLDEIRKYFWSSMRIIARPNISKIPLNDVWFLPRLIYDNISPVEPEKLLQKVQDFF